MSWVELLLKGEDLAERSAGFGWWSCTPSPVLALEASEQTLNK